MIMKFFQKFFALIFATLIFASQSGMAFNFHYCKGVLASITIGESIETCVIQKVEANISKKCCATKLSDSHKKCCKDSNIDLKKISDDEVIVKSFDFQLSPFYIVSSINSVVFTTFFNEIKATNFYFSHFASNAPPLYKLYCQYILYA